MDASTVKKNRSSDVILVVKGIEGKAKLSSTGLVDKRLFTGENQLHAIMDPQTCLWYLKYDQGIVPEPLKQRFTNFTLLENFVRQYFKKRNIEVVEIKD